MPIYKIEAYGDAVFIKEETEALALEKLSETMGEVPREILTISTVTKLPKGEELL